MRAWLLNLLNVKPSEAWLVQNLFFLQFFQGIGVSFVYTAAYTLFITNFDPHRFPEVYMVSGLLLFATGILYSKAEHKLSVKALIPLVIVTMALTTLLLWITATSFNWTYLPFLLLVWFRLLYLLSNLEFWGLSALLFNVRQSKRLFSIVGAGDIPAKLLGYLAAGYLAGSAGLENLVLVSVVAFLASLPFLFNLQRKGALNLHVEHDEQAEMLSKNPTFMQVLHNFFGDKLILYVALLSFWVVSALTIVEYAFYAEVKIKFHGDKELAKFIGTFLAFGRGVAIFIKILFTSRIANSMGIRGALLISPVVLLLFILTLIAYPEGGLLGYDILYVFGMMFVSSEVLKLTIQDPVFITVFQPLKSSLRLKGHTIVKGMMDPFALLFTGAFLWVLYRLTPDTHLRLLPYVLVFITGLWMVLIFIVNSHYLASLVKALNNRYINGKELDANDNASRMVLIRKLNSPDAGEVIYTLHFLDKMNDAEMPEHIMHTLGHPSLVVKKEAIGLAAQRNITQTIPSLKKLLDNPSAEWLLPDVIKTLCHLESDDLDDLAYLLESPNKAIVSNTTLGLLSSGGIEATVIAGQKLIEFIHSSEAENRKMAAEIIGQLKMMNFYKPLIGLLADSRKEVQRAAIQAGGMIENVKLLPHLIGFIYHPELHREAVAALSRFNGAVLPYLRKEADKTGVTLNNLRRIISIAGKIQDKDSISLLQHIEQKFPTSSPETIQQLAHKGYVATNEERIKYYQESLGELMNLAALISAYVHFLNAEPSLQTLQQALRDELRIIRGSMFNLLSFLYDRKKILDAKAGLETRDKERRANAIEVIQLIVRKDFAQKFIAFIEVDDNEDHWTQLQRYFQFGSFSYAGLLNHILYDHHPYDNTWTQAIALYTLSKLPAQTRPPRSLVEKMPPKEARILRETRDYVLETHYA